MFADAPELCMGLELFLDAFNELLSERVNGVIPRSAIVAYCNDEGITEEEQRGDMLAHIRALDIAYGEFQDRKAKDNTDAPEEGLGRGKRFRDVREENTRVRK